MSHLDLKRPTTRAFAVILGAAFALFLLWPSFLLRMPGSALSVYLETFTPLGATESEVLAGAHRTGCDAFVTSVEVFYIFGDDGRLADINIRKTTDGF